MKLSDELIESLLFSLGSDVPTGETRKAPRITARGIALLIPVKGVFRDEGREVYVRDISADGASLLLATPLQVEQFILQLESKKSEPLQILCSVRRCQKSPEGGYLVGAQFIRFLPRAKTRVTGGN
ncbi:MAG TPA: PilZ domain-containing protein [Tepidisphaeraceae bacterium]|nr:PilZ domain-containing protein [Tepidisphaeraceae bacterium]